MLTVDERTIGKLAARSYQMRQDWSTRQEEASTSPAAPWSSMAAIPAADLVSTCRSCRVRLSLPVWHCAQYPAGELQRVADVDTRRRIRCSSSSLLSVPKTSRSTIGDRAFSVAAAKVWNSLPPSIQSSPSQLTFRRALKTELFHCSFGEKWTNTLLICTVALQSSWRRSVLSISWTSRSH